MGCKSFVWVSFRRFLAEDLGTLALRGIIVVCEESKLSYRIVFQGYAKDFIRADSSRETRVDLKNTIREMASKQSIRLERRGRYSSQKKLCVSLCGSQRHASQLQVRVVTLCPSPVRTDTDTSSGSCSGSEGYDKGRSCRD